MPIGWTRTTLLLPFRPKSTIPADKPRLGEIGPFRPTYDFASQVANASIKSSWDGSAPTRTPAFPLRSGHDITAQFGLLIFFELVC